jgi:hypothetical protein
MFGGYSGTGLLGDTWEWNGTQWSQRSPAHAPAARQFPSLAWDPVANATLLYGGVLANGWTDETWHWDGTDWVMRTPNLTPSIRGIAKVATDLHRRRVILFGGSDSDSSTWEWDGIGWQSLQLPGPSARSSQVMAYDTAHRETLLFGGGDPNLGWLNDTWSYSTSVPATATAYGVGCAGSVGVPALANDDFRLPWLGDTVVMRVSNLAPTALAAFFATSSDSASPYPLASFGMPGCNGLVAAPTAEFRPISAGTAVWQLAVPNIPSLVGVQLFQQTLILEPGVNAAGAIISNGVELVAGIR